MGKAAILLVAAAAIGGGALMLSAQLSSSEAEARQNEQRADVLAREAARSVHGEVLDRIVDVPNRTFAASLGMPATFAYSGGQATVSYWPNLMDKVADFTVSVAHSGAVHEIRSQYGWPQQVAGGLPAPVMLQSPWATMEMADGAAVNGNRPVLVDKNPFNELGLGDFLDIGDMTSGIGDAIAGSSSSINNDGGLGDPCSTGSMCGLDNLDDYLVSQGGMPLMELYETLLAQSDENPDIVIPFAANHVFTRDETFGSPQNPVIVHIAGRTRITPPGTLRGYGVFLVEGDVEMMSTSTFEWHGLVMIVSRRNVVNVNLGGTVKIYGSLIGIQEGAPAGGHMDVTVWRDLSGQWPVPNGTDIETPPSWGVSAHAHTHRFDHATNGERIVFARNRNSPHENRLKFIRALSDLGQRDIYLEIGNPNRHGLTQFSVDVTGEGSFTGSLRNGWGGFQSPTASAFQSRTFRADRLRSLEFDVQSLRLLLRGFDSNDTCTDWPACISGDITRKGSLSLRVRDAQSHAMLYEAGVYWHRKREGHPENIEEQLAEERWRERVLSGGKLGFNLIMGDNATITYDAAALAGVMQMVGIGGVAGSTLVHYGSWTRHFSADDVMAGRHETVAPLADQTTVLLCYEDRSISVVESAVSAYLGRGASYGSCG